MAFHKVRSNFQLFLISYCVLTNSFSELQGFCTGKLSKFLEIARGSNKPRGSGKTVELRRAPPVHQRPKSWSYISLSFWSPFCYASDAPVMSEKLKEKSRHPSNIQQNENVEKEDDDTMCRAIDSQLEGTHETYQLVLKKTKTAYDIMKKDYLALQDKERDFKEMTKKLDDVHFVDEIELDVGGKKFTTGLQTLQKYPKSLFSTMFSKTLRLRKSENVFFIDRDGSYFRHVLNYLRTGTVTQKMRENKDELMEEAKFYGLPGLAELLSKNETEKSEEGASEVTLDDGLEELERNSYQTQKILSDAIETLNNGQVSLRKDVSLLEESKEAFLKMAQKLKDTHFSETINLNVGGHTFFTSLSTLQKDPNSMLAAMFSQRFKLNKQEDGSYFIDRDGTHFRHILNYLRSGSLPRELIQDISSELLEEADFYNLSSLTEKVLKSTTIQLKVGNDLYWTTMYILRKEPECLAFLFGENGKVGKINGVYVIKENVSQMENILAFLDNGMIPSNAFTTQWQMIWDAKTLHISSVVNYFMSFKQSKILNGNAYYADLLLMWLKECIDNPCPILVYLMEYGSFKNQRMYSGATLIIAESTKGCIFGGFSSCSWNNTNTYYVAEKCFLFSLVSLEWTEPVILKTKDITSVYSQPTYFQFMNKNNHRCLQLNVNKGPATSFYNVRQDCFIYPDGVPTTTTFLAGEQSFELKRLEVFAVNPC